MDRTDEQTSRVSRLVRLPAVLLLLFLLTSITFSAWWGTTNCQQTTILVGGVNYTVITATSNCTFNTTAQLTGADALVVAGGGGAAAGGGGAGGLNYTTGLTIPIGNYTLTVGLGGIGVLSTGSSVKGGDGQNSSFGNLVTARGGGGAGEVGDYGIAYSYGNNGGSGGGGGFWGGGTTIGGNGTAGQGNAGTGNNGFTASPYPAGGGGGANASASTATANVAGSGGAGGTYAINGSNVCYAGGGGGSCHSGSGTAGAASCGGGAGGFGVAGANGTNGTGGGGGGASASLTGGNGGSGIIIIRFLTQNNTAPTIQYINLTPTSPSVSSTLMCNATAQDAESSSINVSFNWFKNGVNQTALAGSINVSNNTNTNIANISSSYLNPSDNWSCSAQAYDGAAYSAVSSSANVTINNTAPVIDQVTITPVPAFNTNNLSCNVQAHDAESQQLNITYQWFRNGTNITARQTINISNNTLTSVSNLTSGNFSVSDIISCIANASDGVLSSGNTSSPNVTIASTNAATLYTPSTGAVYPSSSSQINFLFNCQGVYPSFYANITINGTDNITAIPVQNATNTTQAVPFFGTGQYAAAVNCYNGTTNFTSPISVFSMIDFAPNITQISITPNGTAYQLGPLAFNVTYVDWESSTATLYYSVFLNGSNQTAMAGTSTLTNNTLANIYLDRFGPFNPTDRFNVSLFVFDGGNQSSTIMSNNTTIGNYFSNISTSNTAAYADLNFNATLNVLISGAASATAIFQFNGINHTAASSTGPPLYAFATSAAGPQANYTGTWFYTATLSNGSTFTSNTTTANIVVNNSGFFLCNATYTASAINYSVIDSVLLTPVNASMSFTYTWIGDDGASIINTLTETNFTAKVCVFPSTFNQATTANEVATATGFLASITARASQNYSSASINRTIQLVNTSFGGFYTFTTRNQYGTPIPNAFVVITKGGTVILNSTTDVTGSVYVALTQLQVYSISAGATGYQNFTFSFTAGPVTTIAIPLQTAGITIPSVLTGTSSGGCAYSNITGVLTCTASSTNPVVTGFGVVLYQSGANSTNCSNTTSSNPATLTCLVPQINDTIWNWGLYTIETVTNESLATGQISINLDRTSTLGRDGWFIMLFLTLFCAAIGAASPVLGIIFMLMGMVLGVFIGLVPFNAVSAILTVSTVMGLVLIWRLRV